MFSKSGISFSGAEHSNSFLLHILLSTYNLSSGSDCKESACYSGDLGSIPGFGKIPWTREWLPSAVLLPRKSHGQRSLAGYSLWGHKKWATKTATNTFPFVSVWHRSCSKIFTE